MVVLGAGMLSPCWRLGPPIGHAHPAMVSQYLVYSIRIVVNAVGVWCGRPWDTTGSGRIGPVDQPGGSNMLDMVQGRRRRSLYRCLSDGVSGF
jgi:hypothetical protein